MISSGTKAAHRALAVAPSVDRRELTLCDGAFTDVGIENPDEFLIANLSRGQRDLHDVVTVDWEKVIALNADTWETGKFGTIGLQERQVEVTEDSLFGRLDPEEDRREMHDAGGVGVREMRAVFGREGHHALMQTKSPDGATAKASRGPPARP